MALITDRQFLLMGGAALLAGGYLIYKGAGLTEDVERAVKTPFNVFRYEYYGLKDDGSTVGSRGWFSNQVDKVEKWLGIEDEPPSRVLPYADKQPPRDIIWIGDIPTVRG